MHGSLTFCHNQIFLLLAWNVIESVIKGLNETKVFEYFQSLSQMKNWMETLLFFFYPFWLLPPLKTWGRESCCVGDLCPPLCFFFDFFFYVFDFFYFFIFVIFFYFFIFLLTFFFYFFIFLFFLFFLFFLRFAKL